MRFLFTAAKLPPNHYTNHSIRATVVTNLDENGFEACHIFGVTGHKLETTIRNYSKKCPENKERDV